MTSRKILNFTFSLSFSIIVVVGIFSYTHIKDLIKSYDKVSHTFKIITELNKTHHYLTAAENNLKEYLIFNNNIEEPFFKNIQKLDNSFTRLKALTENDSTHQQKLKELNIQIPKLLVFYNKTLKSLKEGELNPTKFNLAFIKNKKIEAIRYEISNIIRYEENILNFQKEKSYNGLINTPIIIYVILIITLIIVLYTYFRTSKNLKKLESKNESLEIFKVASNQAQIACKHGNWSLFLDDLRYEFSDNLYRLLGEEPQSFTPTSENFMAFVHPKDLKKLRKQIKMMLVAKNLPPVYYRIIKKNGEISHFKTFGKIITNKYGGTKILGTTRDGGYATGPTIRQKHSFDIAIQRGFKETFMIAGFIVKQIGKLVVGEASVSKNVGGPVEIVRQASEAAKDGLYSWVQLMSMLSISLAVVNLLPFPVLDGGQLLFYTVEAIRGKPLPLRIRERAQQIGVLFLFLLMLFVLVFDINRWLSGG